MIVWIVFEGRDYRKGCGRGTLVHGLEARDWKHLGTAIAGFAANSAATANSPFLGK